MGRGEIDLAMVRMVGAEGKAGPSPWSVELRTDLVRYKMPQLDVFFCGKYGDPARAASRFFRAAPSSAIKEALSHGRAARRMGNLRV